MGLPEIRKLLMKLSFLFVAALFIGAVLYHTESMLVYRPRMEEPVRFELPELLVGVVFIALMMITVTAFRLRPVAETAGQLHPEEPQRIRALNLLLRLPYEFLFGTPCLIFIVSSLYRVNYALPESISPGLAAGTIIFILSRKGFQPVILKLQPAPVKGEERTTIILPLLTAYTGIFLGLLTQLIQAVLFIKRNEPADQTGLIIVAGIYILLGALLVRTVSREFGRDLQMIVRAMRELASGEHGRFIKLNAASLDEAGQLAVAFNELQKRISKQYEEFEKELNLAYNVQKKLLPPADIRIGPFQIVSRCRPDRRVGGDLLDVVPVDSARFAVLIGDVSGKGLPAALVMSAVLVLFRSEVRRGGTTAEVLQRMNVQLCETLGAAGYVSLGVGMVDRTGSLQYSSAGHLAPYLLKADGSLRQVPVASLPIGFAPEEKYEEVELQLDPGDRFVMYTDGIVEARDPSGRLFGFERLESSLLEWDRSEPANRYIDNLLHRLESVAGLERDDRTIVVLECHNMKASASDKLGEEADRTFKVWLLPSVMGKESAVLNELAAYVQSYWPETGRVDDMKSAVAEAVINAMEHGNQLRAQAAVRITTQIGKYLAVFRIYDEGPGYDAAAVLANAVSPDAKRERNDPRGWGLMLIQGLSDYWETGTDEQGFYLELFFLRKTNRLSTGE